jgi:PAS domain S-box-containing protein
MNELNGDSIKRYSNVKKQGHTITAEVFAPFLNNGKGSYIWSIAAALFDTEGNPIGAIESVRDITERKALEMELAGKKALLEAQVESSLDGLLVVDNYGNRLLLNQRLLELWNIPPSIIADTNDEALLQYVVSKTIDPEQFLKKVKYLYDHPEETSRDEISFKDGMVLDRYSSPVVDSNGKHYGRIWSFRDITDRKAAEVALAESEKRFMDVMYASKDAILLIDNNIFVDCNEATARMLGYPTRKEFLMTHPSKLSPSAQPDGKNSFEKAEEMMRIAAEKGFNRFEWVHRKANAEDFPVEVSLTPISLHGRNVIYCVWRDITERKKAEQQLKEAQAQLVQSAKMASVGQLAGGVAHEINNPLVGVLNNVQFIKIALAQKSDFKIDDFKKILDDIEAASLRCTRITRSLLDFSHASNGIRQDLSINEIVEKVISLTELEFKLNNIVIRKQLDPGLPLINGESQLLQQVVLDLLSNAKWAILVKAGKLGGAITAKTGYDAAARSVYLSISDTGIGIPKENMERIFEPFFTTKPVGEGTGLGLALVYNIIKGHQGKVEVKSGPGQETIFKVTLPVVT